MKVVAVGGYEEVGRNMTYIEVNGKGIIIDMGIRLDRVLIHEDTDISKLSIEDLRRRGVIPNDEEIKKKKVKAIILTHGHLDHSGAAFILAKKYNAPIIATEYTARLVQKDGVENQIFTVETGEIFQITNDISVEFINITHSIPQTAMIAVHTKKGTIVYANDFKLDDTPTVGKIPDYKRLKELGKEGVKVLIVETTRVMEEGRTPSEKIAQDMLRDVLLKADDDRGLIVTTFSSHVARVGAIANLAKKIGRDVLILGRSMEKYIGIAEEMKIIDLPEGTHIYGEVVAVSKALRRAKKEKEKYLLIVTGHQGEPDALLTKISNKKVPYKIEKGDQVVFSANVIPNPINMAQRYALETKLKMQGARLFKGLHVSGHASKEDHRDLLKMLNPENIIPCHGSLDMVASYVELAEEEGYILNRNMFILRNGHFIEF